MSPAASADKRSLMAIFSTSVVSSVAAVHFGNFSESLTSAPGWFLPFGSEYKVKRIATRALTNVVSADQKRVEVERQINVLNASEVFDFDLQDAQRYLLVIWLAWLALSNSFIMLSTEISFVKFFKCTWSPLPRSTGQDIS